MNILIPMAGEGSRFKINGYENPKPLIDIDGRPMIQRVLETLDLEGRYIFIVREYSDSLLNKKLEKVLKSSVKNCLIIKTKIKTRGSAETCLLAKEYINSQDKLVITNCDQLMDWRSSLFNNFINKNKDLDGVVVTYDSQDEKNSFVLLDKNNLAKRIEEKQAISSTALVGLHYWKKGSDFVRSAEKMIKDNDLSKGEYYIAPTYNYLVDEGLKITNYHLEENQYIPVGTPGDLKIYIGKKNEFLREKPNTILCDLDGTILKHVHQYSSISEENCELNTGVKEKFDEWDSIGHKIILMTARKESARKITEKCLSKLGIPYDILIMGVTSGNRILINDKLNRKHKNRAHAVSVVTDAGFSDIDWGEYGL